MRTLAALIIGALLGILLSQVKSYAAPKPHVETNPAELARIRAERRATEPPWEACYKQCMRQCTGKEKL